jgi:D-3-phosphoglycerate dehydrogenase
MAGDHFVLNRLLVADLAAADPKGTWEMRELELPWPHEPFAAVAEVDEASGSEQQMIDALSDVRVCLTQMAPLTAAVLDACPDLELFAVSRGGPVNANLEAATAHGVAVTFAPGRNAVATAEYTVGLMLAAMRRIPQSHRGVAEGRWDSSLYAYEATGLELEGTTVGLVGAGAIGSRVARILRGFGADVIVFDPYADPAALPGVRLVELDELLGTAGVVSLHAGSPTRPVDCSTPTGSPRCGPDRSWSTAREGPSSTTPRWPTRFATGTCSPRGWTCSTSSRCPRITRCAPPRTS